VLRAELPDGVRGVGDTRRVRAEWREVDQILQQVVPGVHPVPRRAGHDLRPQVPRQGLGAPGGHILEGPEELLLHPGVQPEGHGGEGVALVGREEQVLQVHLRDPGRVGRQGLEVLDRGQGHRAPLGARGEFQ